MRPVWQQVPFQKRQRPPSCLGSDSDSRSKPKPHYGDETTSICLSTRGEAAYALLSSSSMHYDASVFGSRTTHKAGSGIARMRRCRILQVIPARALTVPAGFYDICPRLSFLFQIHLCVAQPVCFGAFLALRFDGTALTSTIVHSPLPVRLRILITPRALCVVSQYHHRISTSTSRTWKPESAVRSRTL